MLARPLWLPVLLAFLFAGGSASAKPPTVVEKLTANIDHLIAERWSETRTEPAPRADDAEFLRRVYLDLAGRIPSVEEARAFLADPRSDKRSHLVEQLLSGSRYVAHFTNVWRMLLLPEAGNNFQVRLQQPSFEAWLKQMVVRNAGYDEMARVLLTVPLNKGNEVELFLGAGAPTPLAFYAAKEFKPENLAASTARIFHLSWHQRRMRSVPQPPLRQVGTGGILGLRFLLRRCQIAADDGSPSAGKRGSR